MKKPVHTIGRTHFRRKVRQLRLQFLQTDNIRLLSQQPRLKIFAPSGTDTVEVQRDDA
jgi:hypothetical protein